MAKISHTKLKQPSFGEKKVKINLHQDFPIYGISDIAIQVYVKFWPFSYMTVHFTGLVPLTHKYMTVHFTGLVPLTHKYMTVPCIRVSIDFDYRKVSCHVFVC
jgi:hypothetical protein